MMLEDMWWTVQSSFSRRSSGSERWLVKFLTSQLYLMLRGSAFKLMHPDQSCNKNQSVNCLSHFSIKIYHWFAAFLSRLWQYTHVHRIHSIHASDSFVLEAVQCIPVATLWRVVVTSFAKHWISCIWSQTVKLSSWSEVRSWNCTVSETQSAELFLWYKTRSPCWFWLGSSPQKVRPIRWGQCVWVKRHLLGFGSSVGQKKQLEDVTLDSGTLWWAFFNSYRHFKNWRVILKGKEPIQNCSEDSQTRSKKTQE